jgi:hypothetical protein
MIWDDNVSRRDDNIIDWGEIIVDCDDIRGLGRHCE